MDSFLTILAQAYTILESSTESVFLHVTTSEPPAPFWGNILKSNSNGTYFGLSIDNVNRNDAGFVDFEKMIGLDGIALINVVSNPHEAPLTGRKLLQTRITHNDGERSDSFRVEYYANGLIAGGSWRPLIPPATDSQGNRYECDTTVRCLPPSPPMAQCSPSTVEMCSSHSRIHGAL